MKRAGFPPMFAAAIEASASTGGQLMPPIMGAGAFVMASYTQIPYTTIVAVSSCRPCCTSLRSLFTCALKPSAKGSKRLEEDAPSFAS
jgi:TRAP-type uncharacterized transport system fused permease subunit